MARKRKELPHAVEGMIAGYESPQQVADRAKRMGTPVSTSTVKRRRRDARGPKAPPPVRQARPPQANPPPPTPVPPLWDKAPWAPDIRATLDANPQQQRAVDLHGGSVVDAARDPWHAQFHGTIAPDINTAIRALGDPRELAQVILEVVDDRGADFADADPTFDELHARALALLDETRALLVARHRGG